MISGDSYKIMGSIGLLVMTSIKKNKLKSIFSILLIDVHWIYSVLDITG